jgi:hypothetical protein
MSILGVIIPAVMVFVPGYFYSRMGKAVYFAIYLCLSIQSVLRLYVLHGYLRLYYSHAVTLELVLLFVCAIQSA